MNKKEKRALDNIILTLQKLVYLNGIAEDNENKCCLNLLKRINEEFGTNYITDEKKLTSKINYFFTIKPLKYENKENIEKKVDKIMDKREKIRESEGFRKGRIPKGY